MATVKTNMKLAITRMDIQIKSKQNLAKEWQQKIAILLQKQQEASAKTLLPNLMKEDYLSQAMSIIKKFCEMLQENLESKEKTCPPQYIEAVATIIWSEPKLNVKELSVIREYLIKKYGKDFAKSCAFNKDNIVNKSVVFYLGVPSQEPPIVRKYLSAVAKVYGIPGYEEEVKPAPKTQSSQSNNINFPSVPSSTSSSTPNQFSFPDVPKSNSQPSNIFSFPDVPKSNSTPQNDDIPIPDFDSNKLPGSGSSNISFPDVPKSNSQPSNNFSFPDVPKSNSTPPKTSNISFPDVPTNTSSSSGGEGEEPDLDELMARFSKLKD